MVARRSRGRGYSYVVTDEQIRAWRRVPAIEKLRWIESVQRLSYYALGRRGRAIRDRLRQGEI